MISSVANPEIVRVRRLRKRPWRERTGRFLVEGHRAVAPGVHAGRIEVLLHTEAAERLRGGLLEAAAAGSVKLRAVTPQVMASLTSATTAPDVVGIARIREARLDALRMPAGVVIMADVHDPATAGAIAAGAASAGLDAVVFAEACVDAFEQKVVRASAGAHFTTGFVRGVTSAAAITAARAAGCRVVRLEEKGAPPWEQDLGGPVALVVCGAEPGPPDADATVAVPSAGIGANLALRAGVVLYEWMRQGAVER